MAPISPSSDWTVDVVGRVWGIAVARVVSRHQTSPTRCVLRIVTTSGTELALKVAAESPPGVTGGEHVQHYVAQLRPGLAAPLQPMSTGELSATVNGCRVTLADWVVGHPPDSSTAVWSAIGSALAELHALPPGPRRFALPIPAVARELDQQANEYAFGDDFRNLIPRIRALAVVPEATIHGEINAANTVIGDDGHVTFLDWDQAGVGPLSLDLGYPLSCVFLTEGLNWQLTRAEAFYRAYCRATTTGLPEPADIFAAALLHAMRYLYFANRDARWARIQYAVGHEQELCRALRSFRP